MATTAEEELEYESDPEEMKRSLSMRRRKAASDDEEAEREEEEDDNAESKMDPTAVIHSDESDSQGGAAEDYDEDDGEEEPDYEEVEDEVYEEEEIDEEELQEDETKRTGESIKESVVVGNGNKNVDEGLNCNNHNNDVGEEGEEEEKKENEPFSVPTAGAFYMHDDRFRENVAGRNRRTRGGRRLWESRVERKWGHDKFEEMTLQEKHHEDGRRSNRGRYRARSKNHGPDHGQDRGYPRGSGPKAFEKNNQNMAPKAVRGRGPRRYEPMMKNSSQAPPMQNRLSLGSRLRKLHKPIQVELPLLQQMQPLHQILIGNIFLHQT